MYYSVHPSSEKEDKIRKTMLGLHNEHLLRMRGGFTTNYPGASEGRSVSGHSPRNVLETRPQKSSRTPSAPRPRGDPAATPRPRRAHRPAGRARGCSFIVFGAKPPFRAEVSPRFQVRKLGRLTAAKRSPCRRLREAALGLPRAGEDEAWR